MAHKNKGAVSHTVDQLGEADTGLRESCLLFIFYEISALGHQRQFIEHGIKLPVIENQFHPPHSRHGLVKYDAGATIVALNLSANSKFQAATSDAMVAVFSSDNGIHERLRAQGHQLPFEHGGVFTDDCGHHYLFDASTPTAVIELKELRLAVKDLSESIKFYRDTLGLTLRESTNDVARFATGSLDLILESRRRSVDGREVRYDTYLLVFYGSPIESVFQNLLKRGVEFTAARVCFSAIGGTARFMDPSGHIFCLYEPSAESLGWGSGPKVQQLTGHGYAGTAATHQT